MSWLCGCSWSTSSSSWRSSSRWCRRSASAGRCCCCSARSSSGLALAGSQVKRHIRRLRSGLDRPAGSGHRQRAGRAGHRAGRRSRPGHARLGAAAADAAHPRRRPPVFTALAARRMPLITAAAAHRPGRGYTGRPAAGLHRRRGHRRRRRRAAGHCPSRSPRVRLTTLLIGGRVHSPTMPDATAMAVRDGVVAWLGSDDVGRAQFPDAEVVDLDGAFVAPAFVDSHVHVTATGLDAHRARSARRHVAATLPCGCSPTTRAAHPDGPIWGHGWDESGWPDPAPPTHRRPRRRGRRPARLPGARRRPLRGGVHRAAPAAPRPADATGFDPQLPLTADAHHLVRAAARDAADPRAARTRPRWPRSTWPRGLGIVAVHECAGPDIGGLDDWHELRDTRPRRRGHRLLG